MDCGNETFVHWTLDDAYVELDDVYPPLSNQTPCHAMAGLEWMSYRPLTASNKRVKRPC